MRIRLYQLDGKMPNLALMRIARHHRMRGDEVELRQCRRVRGLQPELFEAAPDLVYASLIFERSRPLAEALLKIHPAAQIGGTGWDLRRTLADAGIDERIAPDYSLYPAFRPSLGFTQRGCRLSCEFCVVPRKEGKVRAEATIADIWRGEPWPREILLLDNDFFGQEHWRERIRELQDGKFKVSFNQGINCRMISEEAALAIASVDFRDDGMSRRRVYTAWDSRADEDVLFRGLDRLLAAGLIPDHIMVYMLVGYWHGPGLHEDDFHRLRRLRAFGCNPYPMPFVRNRETIAFQRWVLFGADRRIPWQEWAAARYQPQNLTRPATGRRPLTLFSEECREQAEDRGVVAEDPAVGGDAGAD